MGKPSSAYGWSGTFFFFPGFSGFRPPLMIDRLVISDIFLSLDGQVVLPRVLRFSPIFNERSARYK